MIHTNKSALFYGNNIEVDPNSHIKWAVIGLAAHYYITLSVSHTILVFFLYIIYELFWIKVDLFSMMEIFIIIKFVNMNRIIERVVSQTINKFINENCSKPSIIKENDGDDMGIYKELDDKVYDICYRHGFNVQTRVGNDLAYYAFFSARRQ